MSNIGNSLLNGKYLHVCEDHPSAGVQLCVRTYNSTQEAITQLELHSFFPKQTQHLALLVNATYKLHQNTKLASKNKKL
jgi:hypothetical protein